MAQEETRTEAAEVSAEVAAERRAPRRTAAQMIIVGVIASVIGIVAGLLDRLVPAGRLDAGRQDRHAVGRPDHRLRPGLRARDDRDRVLGPQLPDAARRGEPRRPADPRQHAPRDHLDRDPGDPHRRPVVVRLRRPARHREGAGARRRPEGARRHASSASSSPGRSSTTRAAGASRTAQLYLPGGRVREVQRPVQGRHPRLLGAGLPHEDRRGPGHHDAATASRRSSALGDHQIVCAELCGLGHAFMRQTAHVLTQPHFAAWVRRASRGRRGRWRPAAAARPARRRTRKALFTNGRQRRARPPAARATRWPRRHERHDRPEPRPGPQGQGRGVHQAVDRCSPTRRSRRASARGSCPRTTGVRCRPAESTRS